MLSQFHLELALVGLGVTTEYVQDEGRAVYYLGAQGVFQVALLGWGELVVEDDDVGLGFGD